jgi:hypothetical protein
VGVSVAPESAIAAFEKDMAAIGAVKRPDGVWTRPAPMVPLTQAVTAATAVELPIPTETTVAPSDARTVSEPAGRDNPELDTATEQPRRCSPLHGLLGGLRAPGTPSKPSNVPWCRSDKPILDPEELAEAEALLAAEIAKRRQGG